MLVLLVNSLKVNHFPGNISPDTENSALLLHWVSGPFKACTSLLGGIHTKL